MEAIEKQATLIRVDKKGIERTKKGLQSRADELNKFVQLAETTLKTKFNINEKNSLKASGMTFVNEWIKPKFKFPDADREFNLQALGLNLTPLQKHYNQKAHLWNGLKVEVKNDVFVIPDIDNLPEVKRHFYYAKKDKQIEALEQAKEICKQLNKFQDKGFILHNKWSDISGAFEFVRYGSESGEIIHNEKRMFYPNEHAILKI